MNTSELKTRILDVETWCGPVASAKLHAILADLERDEGGEQAQISAVPPNGEGHYVCDGCVVPHPTGWFCEEHPDCHDTKNTKGGNYSRHKWTSAAQQEPATPVEVLACAICGKEDVGLTTRLVCHECYIGCVISDDSQARAWEVVYSQCVQLGMMQDTKSNGEQQVCEFIRGLAGRRIEQPEPAAQIIPSKTAALWDSVGVSKRDPIYKAGDILIAKVGGGGGRIVLVRNFDELWAVPILDDGMTPMPLQRWIDLTINGVEMWEPKAESATLTQQFCGACVK